MEKQEAINRAAIAEEFLDGYEALLGDGVENPTERYYWLITDDIYASSDYEYIISFLKNNAYMQARLDEMEYYLESQGLPISPLRPREDS